MKKNSLFLGLLSLTLIACYSPDPFNAETTEVSESDKISAIGKIYPVNKDKQVCNPSVSQDTVNYPASMLWLNFGDKLNVNAPDSVYTLRYADGLDVHDRLSVVDTANNVKWYFIRSKGECEFQDPEWSTHANFIVALRGYDIDGSTACQNKDFGIFAVRMSDKKRFWFFEKNIISEATPHVWVKPSAETEKDGDASTVEGFFGTKEVRLTYVDGTENHPLDIVFIDFANGGKEKAIKLNKPVDRGDWRIDSPLISPDGNFVVYNMTMQSDEKTWEAYVQELSKDSKPVKIKRTKDMMSEPAQPHWFAFNGRLFVLWTEFPAGRMQNRVNLMEASAQDGSAGRTVMREIRLTAGAPADLAVEWVGENKEIAPIPMMGGRSPDGKFLATGTDKAYLLKLP